MKRITVVQVVVTSSFHPGCVLLLRRAGAQRAGGHWGLPGGGMEPGESVVEAAARELLEETGVPAAVEDLDYTSVHEIVRSGFAYEVTLRAARAVAAVEPRNVEPDEHDRLEWVAWDSLPEPLLPGTAEIVAQVMAPRRVPEPLWVPTGRMHVPE